METTVSLNELDQRSIAERLPQLGRARKTWRGGEVALRSVAALANRCLDLSLPVNERSAVATFESNSFDPCNRLAKSSQHRGQLVICRRRHSTRSQCPRAPPLRPVQHLDGTLRLEREVQAEGSELGHPSRGSYPQLGGPERRPVFLGDLEPGSERRQGAGPIAVAKTPQSLCIPGTHAPCGGPCARSAVKAGQK